MLDTPKPTDPRVLEAVEVLERTPGSLRGMLAGISDAWSRCDEGPDSFSPVDVLGHLIHGEETDWVPRLRIILQHGEALPFTPFDRFAFRRLHAGKPLAELLDLFGRLRESNLGELRSLGLDAASLARTGTHPALGRVSLAQLLAAWVVHDLGHLRQVARTMARRYREAVGPWREYLSILDEG
jgi:DinB superfamily